MRRHQSNGNLSNKFSSCHTRLISMSHSISLKTVLFSKQAGGHEGIQLDQKKKKNLKYVLCLYMRRVRSANFYRTAFILLKSNLWKKKVGVVLNLCIHCNYNSETYNRKNVFLFANLLETVYTYTFKF